MATPSDKSNNGKNVLTQQVFYPSFDGGLNLSAPPESIAKNELREAINVAFSASTGAMKVRGGLVWFSHFDTEIDAIVPVVGKNGFLVRSKGTRKLYYFRWNNILPVSGELSGDGDFTIVPWDEDHLIASGGKLQRFISEVPPKLETIETENAPKECRFVFVRDGRIGVVNGTDRIRFSGIGDCNDWHEDDNDESASQYVDIGYKDGMDINAVIPLSKDLIIFKSPTNETDKGTIWRLTGNFPNWAVVEVAHNTGTFGQQSVQVVGNEVFYITTAGLATLSNVTAYGEVKTSWPDRKISNTLSRLITSEARLWNVSENQQLWLIPANDTAKVWIFDYALGIWTNFVFPEKLVHVIASNKKVFVAIGQDLYQVNEGYTQDDMKDTGKQTIEASMRLGTLLTSRQLLIKGAYASFEIMPACSADLILGKFKMPFRSTLSEDYIYDPPNDTQDATDDDDLLFPEGDVMTARRRFIVRDWSITPEIKIHGGGCSLSTIGLEMVEV